MLICRHIILLLGACVSPRFSSLHDLGLLLLVLGRIVLDIAILTWIGHLVLKHLDEFVEKDRNKRAKQWSNP